MRVRKIKLDDDENPSAVTVEMSLNEAALLTLVVGKMTGTDAEQIMAGGAEASASVYGCLTGGLFNRFYEDGVNDAVTVRA